jgi:predicted N-acetyltransferase YhbS
VRPPEITTRPARIDDLEAISKIVEAGFESYREFLPRDWEPPPVEEERSNVATRLADPQTRMIVACAGGDVIGHLGFLQAVERRAGDFSPTGPEPPPVAGMVHLWQLFVAPHWWGSGVADLLHRAGIEAMTAQGYERARLFTPSLHSRARRFYERRGWAVVDEQFNRHLGLEMAEYRRPL